MPSVHWKEGFARVGGQCDVVDVIETGGAHQAEKAAVLVRSHMKAEMRVAADWKDFISAL